MSRELLYRFSSRKIALEQAIERALKDLASTETMLETLCDDANPNKDALAMIRNCQDLTLRARVILEEARK